MLTPQKRKAVDDLVGRFDRAELAWLHGYLSGLLTEDQTASATATVPARRLTITYGTESGNSKKLAAEFAARAKKNGLAPRLLGLDQYREAELAKEDYFFTIISTQGEGDPPATARRFFDFIHTDAVDLKGLNYGVLALGDTAYPLFCKAGEDVDRQLQKLGARRLIALRKCDTDYFADASVWIDEVLHGLIPAQHISSVPATSAPRSQSKQVYRGRISSIINLNDRGSEKETYHIEIDAEGVDYAPGDALGIVPVNAPEAVEEVLSLCGNGGEELFDFRGERLSLQRLLHQKLQVAYLPERTVARYAALVRQEIPATRMGFADLLRIYPPEPGMPVRALVEILEPMAPRLYSISSSPLAHPGQVHLTVAREQFLRNEERRSGLCSGYLSQLAEGDGIEFYIHRNDRFRLPAEDRDIIMVGPGTGVAPFRSFLAHRDATGARGRNWLFFGAQRFISDFLYQSEWQSLLETGVLTHLDVAFSRDQAEKRYVQHELFRNGERLWQWLEDGARLYVCGAKEPMSKDVEAALAAIIRQHGRRTQEEALHYMDQLKDEDRYLQDVY